MKMNMRLLIFILVFVFVSAAVFAGCSPRSGPGPGSDSSSGSSSGTGSETDSGTADDGDQDDSSTAGTSDDSRDPGEQTSEGTSEETSEGTSEGTTKDNGDGVTINLYEGKYGKVEYLKGRNPQILFYKPSGGKAQLVSNDLPSAPVMSPTNKRMAYLSPFEWEMRSNLHIFSLEKADTETTLTIDQIAGFRNVVSSITPKKLLWLNERYLLMIMQFAYGTVARGGNLFVYDTDLKDLYPVTKLYEREQITGMSIDKKYLRLDCIEFTDENRNEFTSSKKFVPLSDLIETIRNYRIMSGLWDEQNIQGYEQSLKNLQGVTFNQNNQFKELKEDLDGDGVKDTVRLQLAGQYKDAYVLKVNGHEVKNYGESIDENIYIVDIDGSDKFKEVAVQQYGPSDDYKTDFYYYDGNGLVFMGTLQGLCAEKGNIKGNGIVTASERAIMLQTWFYAKEYKLAEGHLLQGVRIELYPALYDIQTLKLKKDLSLFESPVSSKVVAKLKAGDSITLLGCDSVEWCKAQTASGIKGWFAVDLMKVREAGLDASEVFDGLIFAD